jgi:putative SOS response-associated peptidase YedK
MRPDAAHAATGAGRGARAHRRRAVLNPRHMELGTGEVDRFPSQANELGRAQAVPKMMKWGLIPHWSKYSTINARSEDFRTKPAFRDAWKWGQRCLVVTDGFYEWKKLDPKGKEKQPYAIAMADNAPMVMAGLWAKWKSPEGEQVLSCTILTCGPNGAMGELHDRMPVIVDEADWPKWLGDRRPRTTWWRCSSRALTHR